MIRSIASQLTGVWTLVSYANKQEGVEDTHPFGLQPEGLLIYTPDGIVSAQLMKPGRSLFQSTDWNGVTADEYQESGSGYIAYCGRFEVDEEKETVTHVPSVALVPNLITERQVRSVTLAGDTLTLRANAGLVTSVLNWKKVSGTSTAQKNKAIVLEAFDTLFNKRDYEAAACYWSPDYIQHSAHIGPGRDGLFNLIKSLPSSLRHEPGVIVAEGDYVILHGRFSGIGLPSNWIAADIVLLKDGILVEHWDVIQDEATQEQSKSGRPMFGAQFPTAPKKARALLEEFTASSFRDPR